MLKSEETSGDDQMSVSEYVAVTVPLLGLAVTFGAFRRRKILIGAVIFLASVGFAGIVAIEGNRRPIASLLRLPSWRWPLWLAKSRRVMC